MKRILTILTLSLLIGTNVNATTNTTYFNGDGTEYGQLTSGGQTDLNIYDDLTIMFWFRYNNTTDEVTFLARGMTSGTYQWDIYIEPYGSDGSDGYIRVRTSSNGTSRDTSLTVSESGTLDFQQGVWTHLAITFNSGDGDIYVYQDAVQVGTSASFLGISNEATATLWFNNNSTGSFVGEVSFDDFKIYDVELTQPDIEAVSDCYDSAGHANLSAFWDFESSDFSDITVNANDMTEFNSPTFSTSNLPYTVDCVSATGSTSTIEFDLDEDWYSDDISVIKGRTDIYTDSTSTPSEVRYHFFHIPFFAWIVIFSGIFIIGSRLILEILIRFRNKNYDN